MSEHVSTVAKAVTELQTKALVEDLKSDIAEKEQETSDPGKKSQLDEIKQLLASNMSEDEKIKMI